MVVLRHSLLFTGLDQHQFEVSVISIAPQTALSHLQHPGTQNISKPPSMTLKIIKTISSQNKIRAVFTKCQYTRHCIR